MSIPVLMRALRILVATEVSGSLVTATFDLDRGGRLRWAGGTDGPVTAANRQPQACRYGLPAGSVWYRTLRVPAVGGRGRRRVLAFEAERLFPASGHGLLWDSCPALSSGHEAAELLVGLRAEDVESRLARLRAQGLRPVRMEPAGASLYRGFRYANPAERRPGLIVDLGGEPVQVLAVEGPRWTIRTVVEATSAGGPSRFERIHLEIARLIAGLGSDRTPVWGAVAGGTEAALITARDLAERLAIPVVPFDVWPLLQGAGGTGASPVGVLRSALPVLVGLAAPPSKGEKTLVLLPPAVRRAESRRRRRPVLIASAAAVALSLGTLAWRAGQREAQAVEALIRLRNEMPVLQEALRRSEEIAGRRRSLEERLARARILHEARDVWPRFLADLQQAVDAAGEAWIDRLDPPVLPEGGGTPWVLVQGRLLDRAAPVGGVSEEARRRVKAMRSSLRSAASVVQLAHERFSPDEPGVLRFEFRAQLSWVGGERTEP